MSVLSWSRFAMPTPRSRIRRAAAWGIPAQRVFTDHRELLALPDIDLVEILTPHHLHYQHTLDAAAAGKHISLQKPMAISVAQADEMINAARQAGVIFKVFENFIFYPPVLRAKELIAAGEIGEPLTIRIKSNAANSPNAWPIQAATQEWRFQPEKCGGGPLVFDDGHHKFSLAWYFMGMAEEVHAWIGRLEAPLGGTIGDHRLAGDRLLEVPGQPLWLVRGGVLARDDRGHATTTRRMTASRSPAPRA